MIKEVALMLCAHCKRPHLGNILQEERFANGLNIQKTTALSIICPSCTIDLAGSTADGMQREPTRTPRAGKPNNPRLFE